MTKICGDEPSLCLVNKSATLHVETLQNTEPCLRSPQRYCKLIGYETSATKAKPIEEMYPFVLSFLIFKPSRFNLFTKLGLR